jgi:hypothetical protein
MTTITVNIDQSSDSPHDVYVPFAANAYTIDAEARRRVPFFVPKDQAYYWSVAWQTGEAEALDEIARGEVRRFSSGADAAAWLLSDED